MQQERKRILKMVEEGTITAEEAVTLLEALGKERKSEQTTEEQPKQQSTFEDATNEKQQSRLEKDHSMDDFLEDLRKDFSHVGERFMQFMQTAVEKVKTFDFESPFGNGASFEKIITKEAAGLDEIVIEIDNGALTVHTIEENEIRAQFNVKSYSNQSQEEAEKDFLEKLIFLKDEGTLRLSSDLKFMQVNVELFVPKKDFEKISIRLLNGAFQLSDATVKQLRIKTANGKVDVKDMLFFESEVETANGSIRFTEVKGTKLEAETLNGKVYVDGEVKDIEAQSLNGHVVLTTKDLDATKIEAKTISGSVELYFPRQLALTGEVSSNMGRLDLQLDDIQHTSQQEQFLQRSISFKKDVDGQNNPLFVYGESKTGKVLVRYLAH